MESDQYGHFRRKLLRWYDQHARDLPWRRTHDPYQIWISEIMLQQTTVAAVIPYFERFLNRFPTVFELAAADESEVLRLWEGLGYYSRARNIHRAAKVVVNQHAGVFPESVDGLLTLPGIGRYTAGAIMSFAFDLPAPIVEANTLRLYCRLLNFEGDPRSKAGQAILWTFAESILPKTKPGRLNQAMMELGATVCAPTEPNCKACPVNHHCQAFAHGTQRSVPRPKVKIQFTEVTEASIAIVHRNEYLLRRRTEKERWAGLWDFVRFEIGRHDDDGKSFNLSESIRELTGLQVQLGDQIAVFRHGVTRYRITLRCYIAEKLNGRLSPGEWKWVKATDFDQYPLSVTGRLFAETLKGEHAKVLRPKKRPSLNAES